MCVCVCVCACVRACVRGGGGGQLAIMKISPAKINSLLWIEKAAILPVVLAASKGVFFSRRMWCIHNQGYL